MVNGQYFLYDLYVCLCIRHRPIGMPMMIVTLISGGQSNLLWNGLMCYIYYENSHANINFNRPISNINSFKQLASVSFVCVCGLFVRFCTVRNEHAHLNMRRCCMFVRIEPKHKFNQLHFILKLVRDALSRPNCFFRCDRLNSTLTRRIAFRTISNNFRIKPARDNRKLKLFSFLSFSMQQNEIECGKKPAQHKMLNDMPCVVLFFFLFHTDTIKIDIENAWRLATKQVNCTV